MRYALARTREIANAANFFFKKKKFRAVRGFAAVRATPEALSLLRTQAVNVVSNIAYVGREF